VLLLLLAAAALLLLLAAGWLLLLRKPSSTRASGCFWTKRFVAPNIRILKTKKRRRTRGLDDVMSARKSHTETLVYKSQQNSRRGGIATTLLVIDCCILLC
jgi:hypothetical protein